MKLGHSFTLACAATTAALVFAAPVARAQEVVIGVPMALTGPYAFVGVPIRNGIVMGLEEAQASGMLGSLKLKLVQEDTASEKAQAISLTSRMAVRDKALLIMGPTSSIEGTAAAPVANDLQVPLFSSAVSPDVTKAGKWSFKVTASPAVIMGALGDYVVAKIKPKTAVMVFVRDNDGFIGQKNVIRDSLKAAGVTILSEESVASGDSDFTALATKLVAAKPDLVYFSIGAEAGAALIIQAKQAGLPATTRLIGPPGMASQQFMKVGGSAVEGTILVADYFGGGTSDLNRRFQAAYEKKYGSKPDNWAAVGYSMALVASAALKDAGPNPDRAKVRDALERSKDVPVLLGAGKWNLDAGRNPSYGAAVIMVKGGTFVLAE